MNGIEAATKMLPDGTCVVSVAGALDMETAPRFETEILAAIATRAHRVIIDLTECGFLDSSALTVLVKAKNHLDGAALSLIIAHPHVLKVFELTHLDRIFAIFPTRTAALNGAASTLPQPNSQPEQSGCPRTHVNRVKKRSSGCA